MEQFLLDLLAAAKSLLAAAVSAAFGTLPVPSTGQVAAAQTSTVSFTPGHSFRGTVTGVADGDTLSIMTRAGTGTARVRLRLSCLDAPERGQTHFEEAKLALEQRILRKDVVVIVAKLDKFGRVVGEVDSHDLCADMIAAGHAWHNTPFAREMSPARRSELAQMQAEAEAAGRGLWRHAGPTPPWIYRRTQSRPT